MIKAATAMVKCLEKEGVKVVFGYPGAAICPFYDELLKSDITHVLVRHEVNGGHSASGYARMTGKPGVCIATSGPGATNLITAIATAYMDSIPLVAITGQVNCEQIGRDVFQEADITGAAEPFVKYSYIVKNAQELPRVFKEAFYIAASGRPGPVLIDVPQDIQETLIDFDYPEAIELRSYKPTSKGHPMQIKRVIKAICDSKKPVLCVGGGVANANAAKEAYEFAHLMNIPVVTTMMGLSVFSTDDPLYLGMIGMHGCKAANSALDDCDLLVLLGARVGDRAVKSPTFLQNTTTIIHIDIDPAEIGKNIAVNIPLVGDAKLILQQLCKEAEGKKVPDTKEWIDEVLKRKVPPVYKAVDKGVNPREFLSLLSDNMPRNTTVVADVGQNQIWTASSYKIKDGKFLTSGGMGTMGYSVPAAIGAKLAAPDQHVIAICGDGAFQMQFMEIATAIQHNANIKIVVITNNYLGMVREVQTRLYGDRLTAVSLDGSPDFVKLAQAFGIEAMRVDDISKAQAAFELLSRKDGISLVEVVVPDRESTL